GCSSMIAWQLPGPRTLPDVIDQFAPAPKRQARKAWLQRALPTLHGVVFALLRLAPQRTALAVPRHRQIEQAAERPAADAGRPRKPQVVQPRKDCGQRDVGDHGAGGPGAGAEMRAGAEGDALAGIAAHVKSFRIVKVLLVAVGGAEHQEHALLRLERD